MESYPSFPIFIDLSARKIVVVGAGKIAARRIAALAEFAPKVTVIAPEIDPSLLPLEQAGRLEILRRGFLPADLDGADMVLAATDDKALNAAIGESCRARGILVNVSSDRSRSDSYFPGIARKDNVVVGITASGSDHGLARRVTEKLREVLREIL